MTRSRIAGLLLCALLALGALSGTASAKCVGPAGLVFNCTAGNTPQPGDFVLGGSNTAPQSGQVIRWTLTQFFGAIPLATGTTPGTVFPDGTSITVDGTGKMTALAGAGNAPGGSTWSAQVKGSSGFSGVSLGLGQALIGAASGSPVASTALGTAAYAATGATGHVLPYLDQANSYSNVNTFANNDICLLGSGSGKTCEANAAADAVNRTWTKGPFSGTYLGFLTGSPPVAGQCPIAVDTTGLVSWGTCGGSGTASPLTVLDGFSDSIPNVTHLTLQGFSCVVGAVGFATCAPTVAPKIITGSYQIQPSDMGQAIVLQGTPGTLTIPVEGTGMWGTGQGVQISNESTGAWTVVVTSGTGAVTVEPSNPATIPAMVNNVPTWVLVLSDGANLHPFWGSNAPGAANTTQAQSWTAPQRTNYSTPAIVGSGPGVFTPAIGASQNYRINLVHAACPCSLANPSGTLVAGQQGIMEIAQSSTGNDTITTWGSDYEYPGGTSTIALSTGASAVDYLPYAVDSTATHVVLGTIVQNPVH